jgi:flagellar hook-length control protein FliK
MDPIAAMPMNTANVTDAQTARDMKGADGAEDAGFGQALMQGIAARNSQAGDGQDSAAEETVAAETVTEAAIEETPTADVAAVLDPALAALLADAALQQPAPAAAAGQIAVAAVATQAAQAPAEPVTAAVTSSAEEDIAQTAPAERAPADRALQRGTARGADRYPVERDRIERLTAEKAANDRTAERPTLERDAPERIAADRGTFDKMTERGAIERAGAARGFDRDGTELRDLRPLRDADDRLPQVRDKDAADTPTASFLAAFGADRGAAAETPLQTSPALSGLDSLSAASLSAKWGAPGAIGTGDAAPSPVTARVDTPMGAPGWGEAFQQKVVWMVDRQLERAELHVNPPHLGPVDVMLNLSGDGAQIAFSSPHAAVREAIEASLPELRSALDERGLSLGQATVSADSSAAREQFADQAREAAKNAQHGRSGGSGPIAAEAPTRAAAPIARRGLVDTFA